MTPRRVLLALAGVVAVLYAVLLGCLYFLQGSLIYPGRHNTVAPSAPHENGAQLLTLALPFGTTEALFLPATASIGAARMPVVIFAHGNGEVIDYWVNSLDSFRERGIGVLLVEYPGYGRSRGSPSEATIRMALDAAYDRIAADPRIDRERIFGFGQSLGGGAICQLARDRSLRALILQSTFTSLDIFTAHYLAPAFLLRSHFDSLAVVKQFPGPVLVIHGLEDPLIPYGVGKELAAAAVHSTFKIYACGHLCWDPEHLPFWQDATPVLQSAGIFPQAASGARRQ